MLATPTTLGTGFKSSQVRQKMNEHQTNLLNDLMSHEATPAARAILKRTIQQFVFEYGWWYEPVEVPKDIAAGQLHHCHKNAAVLADEGKALVYCEGFAVFKPGMSPTLHAWVTNGQGSAIDNTWPKPGVAYAGVPFKSLFVTMTALKNRATVSLLDDWQNRCPLLGDLGDEPDKWLESQGYGVAKVAPG